MYDNETCYKIDPSYNLTLVFRSSDQIRSDHHLRIFDQSFLRSIGSPRVLRPCSLPPARGYLRHLDHARGQVTFHRRSTKRDELG
jgi:hypothetical protein